MANEKRLIDANALLKELDKFINPMPDANGLHFISGLSTAITEIEDAPTVDAVEVVHSCWDTVFYERKGVLGRYSHLCPECKYAYQDLRADGHNYCPNCGAKMDGGNEDV